MRQPLDPVVADEIRHDKELEHAQELVDAQIDETMDTIWAEVAEGEHDIEMVESAFIDVGLMSRIARSEASGTAIHPCDPKDLYLQITDYVRDVAEMRLTR
jgi:hypothetical protein